MAQNKGNDPKATDSKPGETRSSAVKPPVLDMTARDTTPEKPVVEEDAAFEAAKPEDKIGPEKPADETFPNSTGTADKKPSEEKASSFTPAPKPSSTRKAGFSIATALTGGVLGLAAAYGLAVSGYWPSQPAPAPQPDPQLAQLADTVPGLRSTTEQNSQQLSALDQRIAALESAPAPEPAPASEPAPSPEPQLGDVEGLSEELDALSERVEQLSNTPPAEDDTAELAALRNDLSALDDRLGELGARIGTAEASLQTLGTTVSQNAETLAGQPTDIGAVLQLPLVLSGLEQAFGSGRPYEDELAALRSARPDVAVPTEVANAASSGLTRPDQIIANFEARVPSMLAGRPADPQAQWQEGALDWFRSAIALRPSGEQEGDSPEAVMSRLEIAMQRRDWVSAQDLLQSLPQPMQAAAGDVPQQLAGQAAADRLLDSVRSAALQGGSSS